MYIMWLLWENKFFKEFPFRLFVFKYKFVFHLIFENNFNSQSAWLNFVPIFFSRLLNKLAHYHPIFFCLLARRVCLSKCQTLIKCLPHNLDNMEGKSVSSLAIICSFGQIAGPVQRLCASQKQRLIYYGPLEKLATFLNRPLRILFWMKNQATLWRQHQIVTR